MTQNIEASGGEQLSYADGLARLYEFIAGIIDEQQSLVEEHFGTEPRSGTVARCGSY